MAPPKDKEKESANAKPQGTSVASGIATSVKEGLQSAGQSLKGLGQGAKGFAKKFAANWDKETKKEQKEKEQNPNEKKDHNQEMLEQLQKMVKELNKMLTDMLKDAYKQYKDNAPKRELAQEGKKLQAEGKGLEKKTQKNLDAQTALNKKKDATPNPTSKQKAGFERQQIKIDAKTKELASAAQQHKAATQDFTDRFAKMNNVQQKAAPQAAASKAQERQPAAAKPQSPAAEAATALPRSSSTVSAGNKPQAKAMSSPPSSPTANANMSMRGRSAAFSESNDAGGATLAKQALAKPKEPTRETEKEVDFTNKSRPGGP